MGGPVMSMIPMIKTDWCDRDDDDHSDDKHCDDEHCDDDHCDDEHGDDEHGDDHDHDESHELEQDARYWCDWCEDDVYDHHGQSDPIFNPSQWSTLGKYLLRQNSSEFFPQYFRFSILHLDQLFFHDQWWPYLSAVTNDVPTSQPAPETQPI